MNQQTYFLTLQDFIQVSSLSRSTIYALLDEKSPRHDPSMPRPSKISARRIGFRRSDVEAWLASKV